jgi:hypothetical protein
VLLRRFVSPASKVRAIVEQGLHISDADFGRIDALLEQYGLSLVEKAAPVPAPAETPAPVTAPDGMSAGTTTPAP